MKRILVCAISVALLLCWLIPAAGAEADAVDRFCGAWAGDGVRVEIRRVDETLECRAVFETGDGERDVWAYSACWYDEAEDAVLCGGIVRTSETYSSLFESWEETDWAMDDFCFARFDGSESGLELIWSDDGLETPIVLQRSQAAE